METENKTDDKPEIYTEEHKEFLDILRESGKMNMFGAAPYLAKQFKISIEDARKILAYWMTSFE